MDDFKRLEKNLRAGVSLPKKVESALVDILVHLGRATCAARKDYTSTWDAEVANAMQDAATVLTYLDPTWEKVLDPNPEE
ncbi:MAG: hypothetical protein KGJ23_08060 [Euryarchaeota archaeon]|nr:hypothetical protein [Euryarchaeota archaeon]MDE1836555.1 hypothetical protein [Euryarchaeota archaeon]MDE1879250.1 hypothetical protein [Euryarchaeota archaeon]MDE2044525.1 hypothetical protein [Thermoplasmata archaeon]